MTIRDLLAACRRADILLHTFDGRLRYRAPAGALTDTLKQAIQEHKAPLVEAIWRLDGMRGWRLAPGSPVPVAVTGQQGGPGHCHSCGVVFADAGGYGRCEPCWMAYDEWLEEQAQRADGAVSEV